MTTGALRRWRIATRAATAACAALAAFALLAPPGQARRPGAPPNKAIWGPVQVNGVSQFGIYRDLGVDIFQIAASWRDIAPTRPSDPRDPNDPAYRWPADLDLAVREASRTRMRVLIMLIRTPAWANGGREGNYPPRQPSALADFAEAAARRYRAVRHWMVWGEPIRLPNFFVHPRSAQQIKTAGPFTPAQRADTRKYAELLDSVYARLKRENSRNLIIGGNTTTYGELDPYNWIKNLKLSDGRPPRMDMYGHNPFGTRGPDLRKPQLVPGTADFCDLELLAGWLDRYLARGGRNRRLPIFISEYTAPTDKSGYEFPYYVTRAVQAKWLTAGLGIAKRWARIDTFGWIGLRDIPPRAQDGLDSRTGLIDGRGVRKLAYFAYRRG